MSGIDTSIYRTSPSDPLTGVSNALSIANAAKQNQILGIQQQTLDAQNQMIQGNLQGQTQYGNALSGALRPDGSIDPAAANRAYIAGGGNPIYAGTAFNNSAALTDKNITNTGSQSDLIQKQMDQSIARASAAAAAGGGRSAMLKSLNTDLSNGSLTPQAFHNIVDPMPPGDKLAGAYIKSRAIGTASSSALATPTAAGSDNLGRTVLKPAVDVATAAGQPGGTITSPEPGAVDVAAKDKTQMQEDQLLSGRRMADLRPLQSALPLISQLSNSNFGPGSAEFAKLKGALTTAGIINQNTSDLQVRQEANKYLLQYANGAQQAGRSDAALSSALGSNPNLDLTQPANLALVKSQIARDRMDAAIPKAYASEAKPNQTYTDFKSGYYQQHDPRAFQIDTMTPDERAKLQSSLGPKGSPAYEKFVKSYQLAKQSGMLQPGQGQ